MTKKSEDLVHQLPLLLKMLAEPTTPHTAIELWCRITAFGWNECVPTLLHQLAAGTADVKRLVLEILWQEVEQLAPERVRSFIPLILTLLNDSDRLVRMTAIQTVRTLRLREANPRLRQIACSEERLVAAEALMTLIDLDETFLDELLQLVRAKRS